MEIVDNFEYSGIQELDERKIWESFGELRGNTTVLMPMGFEVYCKEEDKYYELYSSDENDPSTYMWRENNKSEKNLVYDTHEIVTAPRGYMLKGMDLFGMNVFDVISNMVRLYIHPQFYFVPSRNTIDIPCDYTLNEDNLKIYAQLDNGSEYIPDGTDIKIYKNPEYDSDNNIITDPIEVIKYQNGQNKYYMNINNIGKILDSTKLEARVSITNMIGKPVNFTREILFKYRPYIYWGACSSNKIDEIDLMDYHKVTHKLFDYDTVIMKESFTTKVEYCFILTPVELFKILDENGFDNTDSFDKQKVTLTYKNGISVEYFLYTTDYPVTCTDFKYKFFFEDVEEEDLTQ